jgi:2'-hydroxyisoflavone reductase
MAATRRSVMAGSLAMATLAASDALAAPPKPLRILILGGTGFIGPHQVSYALDRGHKLTLFNRGHEADAWGGRVEQLTGDRSTGDLKALAGREWDVCIDNPTTLPFWVRDAGHVLAGKVKQYIFISTISVYADNKPGEDERAALVPYTGKDAMAETSAGEHRELYGPLKAVSEAEAKRQFGEAVTIIRPGLIAGPGDETDRFTYWPVRLSKGGDVLAPGDGKDRVQFIDARDLAEWTIRMAETRTFGVFNATGPAKALQMRPMLDAVRAGVGGDAKLVWVSDAFLDVNKVEAWSDMPVWVPRGGDDAGFVQRNTDRALAAGLTFRPIAETARDTLAWFKTQPADRQAKLRAGLAADREAQLLAQWRAKA